MCPEARGPAPINRLRGVVPTPSIWGVNPANLERCTDDDWAVATGLGTTNTPAAAIYGQLLFDLGAVYNVHVRGKLSMSNNLPGGDTHYIHIEGSENGVTYYPTHWYGGVWSWFVVNADVIGCVDAFVRARYIRIRWECSGGGGVSDGSVYELQAIDFGL